MLNYKLIQMIMVHKMASVIFGDMSVVGMLTVFAMFTFTVWGEFYMKLG